MVAYQRFIQARLVTDYMVHAVIETRERSTVTVKNVSDLSQDIKLFPHIHDFCMFFALLQDIPYRLL
jgi:hypothetical protein